MASSYALPVSPPGGNHHHHYQHHHSHSYTPSYSAVQLSPKKERTSSFGSNRSNGYGHHVKKAGSNGSLYTHAEVSPERGSIPPPLPNLNHDHFSALQQNAFSFQTNNRSVESLHKHSHQYSSSSMKSRPRGESDLGRPQQPASNGAARSTLGSLSLLSIPEALTSILIPLPFLFISATRSLPRQNSEALSPLSAFAKLQHAVLDDDGITPHDASRAGLSWVDTCIVTSGTLLLVGGWARMRASTRTTESRKDKPEQPSALRDLAKLSTMRTMTTRALSVGLPFFAAIKIGGLRTGTILLVSYTASMTGQARYLDAVSSSWKQKLTSRTATLSLMGIALLLDLAGITSSVPFAEVIVGYVALACAMLMLDSPLPKTIASDSSRTAQTPTANTKFSWSHLLPVSSLTRTVHDANLTLTTGVVTSTLLLLSSLFTSDFWNLTLESIVLDSIAVAGSATAIFLSRPASLQTRHKAGLGLGCLCIAFCSFHFSPSFSPGTICNLAIIALFYLSVYYDTTSSETHQHHELHDHDHDHAHSTHGKTNHLSSDAKHSAFTRLILNHCEPDSLVHGIVSEKDSRRIAYFTLLNFGFMLVQGLYGYLSGSLGLLSDTVHMFFDCLGLVIGLAAAVASKWPTSPEKPYGWGKLNTLAGFGNGIFLMLVSVEFVWEAIEGIVEHRELRHVQELLVVSSLGLMVNMVGLFAFGHAHAGHDHGHGHGHHHDHSHDHAHHDHSHSHSHEHPQPHDRSRAHSHDHSRSHGHGHGHGLSHSHSHSDLSQPHGHEHHHSESHGPQNHTHDHEHDHHTHEHQAQSQTHVHDHHNENMHGIYLHVAADAGGSLAVILSTLLTLWSPWYLWDPLATIIIAILIFAAAVPLVVSSGQKLLLVVPDQLEYSIKDTLQGLGELRGVIGYAVPRFWIDDKDAAGDSHGHHHHGHDHSSGTGCEKILGVIHIIAAPLADLEDVRRRVDEFVRGRNMELVIHVEREGEDHEQCWCSGG